MFSPIKKLKWIMPSPPNSLLEKDEATVNIEKENLIKRIKARRNYYQEGIDESIDKKELYIKKRNMLNLCKDRLKGKLECSNFECLKKVYTDWDSGFFSQETAKLVAETTQFAKDYEEYKVINRNISSQSKMKSATSVYRG